MPFMRMKFLTDPKKEIWDAIGDDINNVELFNNQVLVAIFIRPEKTAGGIMLANQTRDEDKWQGKVGLVLKKGPAAFVDTNNVWFNGVSVEKDDWVFFRPAEGWALTVCGVMCRILDDVDIRGKISSPDEVW